MSRDGTVKSIVKAVDILSFLASSDAGQPLGAVSRELGMHPTTARRLLMSLQHTGMVHQDSESRLYFLGLRLLELGSRVPQQNNLVQRARPVLEQLVQECMETAYLAVYNEGSVVYLDTVECERTIKTTVQIGQSRPAHTTGTGQVLLSHLSDDALRAFVAQPLEKRTAKTITDETALRAALDRIRRDGYAVTVGEHDEGVSSVAAPIMDFTGRVVAAISLSGPSYRLDEAALSRMAASVTKAARQISTKMGATGAGPAIRVPR